MVDIFARLEKNAGGPIGQYMSYDRGHMTIGRFRVEDVDRLPHFKKPADITLWKKYHCSKSLSRNFSAVILSL